MSPQQTDENCRRANVHALVDWLAEIATEVSRAVHALEKLDTFETPVARLCGRASFPLAFAYTAVTEIADYLEAAASLRPPDDELVAQCDASGEVLRKAFSAARLHGAWRASSNHPQENT